MNFILPLQIFFILCSFFYPAKQEEPCCKINVPNVVAHNGDGIGYFTITVGCDYNAFEMLLFDRWGTKLLDEKTKGSRCLDSLNSRVNNFLNKKRLPEGAYFYLLKAMNQKDTCMAKGNISILR